MSFGKALTTCYLVLQPHSGCEGVNLAWKEIGEIFFEGARVKCV